ncbi:putative ABC transporter ATP-binding protein [Kordia antarctica]|uniref:Putative ABC transporter ATP-binding protein n=1 Tax=Kordia antarctica TaxID=1218801 RepID=A0A7L4ZI25_9FLAO|nr:ABC transporter ATP-binding protein [Kordia antarctica]QHI36292.1 putative ABC transporter ATP-binding protein [Kordia antarctica]
MAKVTGKVFDVSLFKRLLFYTNPYKLTLYFVAIAAILLSVFAIARPILLKITVDDYILTKDKHGLLIYVLFMLGFLILEVIFQFLFVFYANWLGQSIIKDIRQKLFNHMLNFKMAYYDKSSVGRLVTRAVSDIETIASIFSQGLFVIIADLLKMLVVMGVMLWMSWKLSLIVFAILPLIIYATRVFQKAMKSAFEEVRAQISNLNSFVQERVTGMKIVQLFSREETEYKNFKSINEKHKQGWLKTVWYNSIFFPIPELANAVAVGLVVWYGGLMAATSDTVDVGEILAFIMMIGMLFRPLRQIADKFNTLQMGMVAAGRVFSILDTESKIEDDGKLSSIDIKGNITFKDVHFSYVEDEEVLHGISFEVKQGQTVAIVGATGAGKSTIINLLNRFYEIDSGTIYIDDINIEEVKLAALRAKIAVVLQDVFMFADTILNNITLENPAITRETVIKAAKQIGVHDFIMSLPNNYDYNVKERGGMLSSGQRQLISFLRAYVTNPRILILDEATSSVDSYSEQLIQNATDTITKGRTSIVIAHRLATIKKADTIIVMDAGNIVEQGSHTELLQIEKGYYRNLYEVQFIQQETA